VRHDALESANSGKNGEESSVVPSHSRGRTQKGRTRDSGALDGEGRRVWERNAFLSPTFLQVIQCFPSVDHGGRWGHGHTHVPQPHPISLRRTFDGRHTDTQLTPRSLYSRNKAVPPFGKSPCRISTFISTEYSFSCCWVVPHRWRIDGIDGWESVKSYLRLGVDRCSPPTIVQCLALAIQKRYGPARLRSRLAQETAEQGEYARVKRNSRTPQQG
jgi:hypothetical protein